MQDERPETGRDRVRRLLIGPLQEAGFRFRKGTVEDKAQADLDRIADSLGYLSDRALDVLRASLLTKGEGAARCFWPAYATIVGLAEAFEPRPLEEVPEIARWFRSAAGREAMATDRLAAEFAFWEKLKRPPVSIQDKQRVGQRAAEWRDRALRIRDRVNRGIDPFPGDAEWLAWYDALTARAASLVGERAA